MPGRYGLFGPGTAAPAADFSPLADFVGLVLLKEVADLGGERRRQVACIFHVFVRQQYLGAVFGDSIFVVGTARILLSMPASSSMSSMAKCRFSRPVGSAARRGFSVPATRP